MEPERTYQFRFAAFNQVGLGDWGANQGVTMSRRSAPNEPLILNKPEDGIVSSPYSDHFDLRWNIPADNGETIILYHIKFCPVSDPSWVTVATPSHFSFCWFLGSPSERPMGGEPRWLQHEAVERQRTPRDEHKPSGVRHTLQDRAARRELHWIQHSS